jgi:S-adenosylmethionine hydrolase
MRRIITLTTDFGLKDHYVAAMKGVILSINPEALIVDVTHEIPPQDVFKAAFTVRNFYRYFPRGSINVVVVDPGVGSKRRAIVVKTDYALFIGPDNGVFTFVYKELSPVGVFKISNPRYFLPEVSSTFHGRDIFAPVAAHLSLGVAVEDLGKRVKKPVELRIREPELREGEISGEVIYEDHFGNLITNIPGTLLRRDAVVIVDGITIEKISTSYAEVPRGSLLAIVGSTGFLEISVNQGKASQVLRGKSLRVRVILPAS